VLLVVIAALMAVGSVERLIQPQAIQYREATGIAVLGLVVNAVCAFILGHAHHGHGHGHHEAHAHHHGHAHAHAHAHGHSHGHDSAHHDLNLKSAYLHVLADAATSVLAIVALLGGWFYGWDWLDPVMGLVGALLVAWWARGLLGDTARVLLDREMDDPVVAEIREAVESDGGLTRLTDLHVWRVGRNAYACALTAVTQDPALTPQDLRARLAVHEEVVHATLELHRLSPP
jgi:cation diffusion facilitator family transporter